MSNQKAVKSKTPAKVGASSPKGAPKVVAKPSPKGAASSGGGGFRFRLLPVTIFGAVLLLGVRVLDLWQVATTRDTPLPDIQVSEAKDAGIVPPAGESVVRGTRSTPRNTPGGMVVAAADQAKPAEGAAGQGDGMAKGGAAEGAGKGIDGSGDPLSPINNEDLLKHYAERRAELDKQAKDVSMREALLSAAEKRIEQKLKELEKVRGEIQNLLKLGDERQSQQLDSLVKIYETMKPKDAARIFEELELPVLLDVIQKMKETKTAPILAAMDPVKAKEVTSALVERRILPSVPQ